MFVPSDQNLLSLAKRFGHCAQEGAEAEAARHKSAVQSRDAQVMDLRTSHAELRRDCERHLLRLGALGFDLRWNLL